MDETEAIAEGAGGNGEKKDRFRVYVANLPSRVTTDDLEQAFQKIGKVLGVLIPKSAKYAFVDYSVQEEAERAVTEMHQYVLNGSSLRVEMGKGEPRTLPGDKRKTARTRNRVIVTGLSSGLSWQDLKDIMRETGGDVTFTSIKDSIGYAEFATEGDVDRAIAKLDGTEVRGSRVNVKRDEVADRDLERDQPSSKRDNKKKRDDGGRRRRERSRSPPRRGGGRRSRASSPAWRGLPPRRRPRRLPSRTVPRRPRPPG